ncbi:MAG: glycosyltransferase [Proteobacteria bacterium]|uniref:glycosyltransferase n=1 Tax=Rudaea sp. TaxID=2136325 RepID=UPI001DDA1D99|nr:glycosyltransferase [Pseudomonadota bacterium]MBS0568184.1 glycosyltransferase [Pseudomonadota bacterium]
MAAEPRPLRVLMVLDSCYPAVGGGGAESQVRTLALHLKRIGQRATILTPRVPHGRQVTIERIEGIPVVRIRYPFVRGIGSLVLWARFVTFLSVHGRRYDAWHAHIAHYLAALAAVVGAMLGKPVVLKVSGWWELKRGVLDPQKGLLAALARRGLRKASAVQAISRRIGAELAHNGFPAERIVALPNAVDTSRFGATRPPRNDAAPTFLFVGRLVAEKGLDTLFGAWADAFGTSAKARLLLVGDGALREPLLAQAKTSGIAAQIEFLGHRSNVEEFAAAADIGVLPSTIEGLSNSLLEFMASGLPTIASRVSGSEDMVIPGNNGWLFDVGDRTQLAHCLLEAASMDRTRLRQLGAAARARIAHVAGLDNVVGKLLALYRGTRPAELCDAAVVEPTSPGGV